MNFPHIFWTEIIGAIIPPKVNKCLECKIIFKLNLGHDFYAENICKFYKKNFFKKSDVFFQKNNNGTHKKLKDAFELKL